jgi:hypothetical protein
MVDMVVGVVASQSSGRRWWILRRIGKPPAARRGSDEKPGDGRRIGGVSDKLIMVLVAGPATVGATA